jgi:hypothetical protein
MGISVLALLLAAQLSSVDALEASRKCADRVSTLTADGSIQRSWEESKHLQNVTVQSYFNARMMRCLMALSGRHKEIDDLRQEFILDAFSLEFVGQSATGADEIYEVFGEKTTKQRYQTVMGRTLTLEDFRFRPKPKP